ncbi:hypothetical protein ACSLPA_34400, partial [Escherichia coli]
DSPLFAAIHKPEEQPDKLFRSLGFEQTWKEWSDSQKAEDRQDCREEATSFSRCDHAWLAVRARSQAALLPASAAAPARQV